MQVNIENLQDKKEIGEAVEKLITEAAGLCLKQKQFDIPSEINILIVDDAEIKRINSETRNIDKTTDVLSFPMLEFEDGKPLSTEGDIDMESRLLLLGDIVISIETVERQAEEYGHSLERELAFMVTHGMFHLLGLDHETPEEEKEMFTHQEEVLNKMGLKRS